MGEILRLLGTLVKAGATTAELDAEAEKRIRAAQGEPAFKGYRAFGISTPFPGSICVSINEEIVHGLPHPERQIKEGDVVSIDIGMKYKDFYTDTAITVGVPRIDEEKRKLIDTARGAMETAIKFLDENIGKERITTGDLGSLIHSFIHEAGFNVVRELVGHRI